MLWTKDQLVFVVKVMYSSCFDVVLSYCDGYNFDPPIKDLKETIHHAIASLGWNLSIFSAQVLNDGIGCGDAIAAVKFENKDFDDWLKEYFGAKIRVKDDTVVDSHEIIHNASVEYVETVLLKSKTKNSLVCRKEWLEV